MRFAHADVGVVVSGDPNMQARVLDQAQRWLQDKKQVIVAAALGAASATFIDCFVMEDMACARKLVDEQAKAGVVVFIRVDMSAAQSRDYSMTAFWFTKGSAPITEKRACTQCDDTVLRTTVDMLMADLSRQGTNGKGQLKITGGGDGMTVKIDGDEVGAPPVSRELAAGSHELVFVHGGAPVDVRRIEVDAGDVVEVTAPHVAPRDNGPIARPSRLLPGLLIAGGLVAAAAGGVLLYYGSLRGPDEPYEYKNATEIGLPLALAGAFAVGAGTSLWFARSGSDAQVGVSGTF